MHQEFADDIILDYSHTSAATVCTRLTHALTALANWLAEIGLLLNASKTQVMLLRPRGSPDTPCVVKCNGTVLDTTRAAKYLGVIIDDELSWKPHADLLSRKAAQVTGQLWRHGQCLSLRARRLWYVAMLQSNLMYASNSFFPGMSKNLVNRVIALSKAGIRSIFRVRPRTETAPLIARLHIRSLHQLLCEKLLVFVHRCIFNNCSALLSDLFDRLVPDNGPGSLRVTRGQSSNLLRIPFLPNQSGRRSIQFVASAMWNELRAELRTEALLPTFRLAITQLDLPSLRM